MDRSHQRGTADDMTWTPASTWLFLQAIVLIPTIRIALRVIRFGQLHDMLASGLPTQDPTGAVARDSVFLRVHRVVHVVDLAARHTPVANTCLHRSIVLWWLLGRRGVAGVLRFGVRKNGDHIDAHAWVEYRGTVLNDRPTVQRDYVRLTNLPAKNARFVS